MRIEDDVVIWAKGNENMSLVPRTVEDIEQFMTKKTRHLNIEEIQEAINNYLANSFKI